MERDESTTAEDLDRPEGNDLESNYELHDCGEAEFLQRVDESPFEAEAWGIDMRDEDGDEGIIYDDKLDFRVYGPEGNLVGLVDVKTKSNPKYMGTYNERHYVKYYEQSEEHEVPSFVVMYQVDYSTNTIFDTFVHFVGGRGDGEMFNDVYSSTASEAVGNFPDGNNAVLVPHEQRHDVGEMFAQLTMESMVYADR